MTTFVLVHGAWHGPWAWAGVRVLLEAAGADTAAPDLNTGTDRGLHDDAARVIDALDSLGRRDDLVLVGHSYAGLVVREAADARADVVRHVALVDGWAGSDGASLFSLASDAFTEAMTRAAGEISDRHLIPAPSPSAFGIVDDDRSAFVSERLVAQPLRTFAEATRLSGAVDGIPGTAIWCSPATFPFRELGERLGYRTLPIEGPHDVMLTAPVRLAELLLDAAGLSTSRTAP